MTNLLFKEGGSAPRGGGGNLPSRVQIMGGVLVLLAGIASAQVQPPTSGDLTKLPTYLTGFGVETNPLGAMATIAVRIGNSNLYSWTSIDTPYQKVPSGGHLVSSVRTGAGFVAAHSGSCFLALLATAGFVNGTGSTTFGAYDGGGALLCALKKAPNLYFGPIVSATALPPVPGSTTTQVSPAAKFAVFYSFGN